MREIVHTVTLEEEAYMAFPVTIILLSVGFWPPKNLEP